MVGRVRGLTARIWRAAPGGVRLRVTVAAVLTVAVVLSVASAGLLWVLRNNLENTAQVEAAAKASAVALAVTGGEPAIIPDREVIEPVTLTFTDASVLPPGQAAPRKPTVQDVTPITATSIDATPITAVEGGVPGGGISILYRVSDAPGWMAGHGYMVAEDLVVTKKGTMVVQGRTSLAPTQAAMRTMWRMLVLGVPALSLLVGLLTWFAVGRALKPVSAIRGKLDDITAYDLHERVPEPNCRDEIAALARTVNATLDRLQAAVEKHKRFIADAAHELRSPLAVLRTRLELTRSQTEAPVLAGQALTDVHRIQTLTVDLLLLARLDAGEPLRDEEADLGQVVAEEAAKPRPREVAVDLDIAADVLVRGSADQLARLVANLVDNAVRHASTGVQVRLTTDGALAVLEVADDGPGIPLEHRETVFDRFTRLDQARTRDGGGSGLGLAIARDIAVAHGGSLTVASTPPPGACLRAVLPVA